MSAEVITTLLGTTPVPVLTFHFREDEAPYSWQEAYDEALAAGRRLPTLAEMREYILANPTLFSSTFTTNFWAPVVNSAVANGKDWCFIGVYPDFPRGTSFAERYGGHNPVWGENTSGEHAKFYFEVSTSTALISHTTTSPSLTPSPARISPLSNGSLADASLADASLANASLANASLPNQYLPDALGYDCVACPAGTFKTPLGAGSCVPCPADHYCPPASAGREAGWTLIIMCGLTRPHCHTLALSLGTLRHASFFC
jgi:hypothetical protein